MERTGQKTKTVTIPDFNVQFCVGMAPISLEKTQVYAEESIAEAFRSAAARGHMGRGGTGIGGDQIGAEIAAVEAAASRIIQRYYHPPGCYTIKGSSNS